MRSQVSLDLDGELSELERLMVARHLERCADCQAFRDRAVDITHKIRSAPLERFERRIALPRLHRGRLFAARDVAVRASAMAAGLALVLGLAFGERGALGSAEQPSGSAYVDTPNGEMQLIRELRDYRLLQNRSDVRPI